MKRLTPSARKAVLECCAIVCRFCAKGDQAMPVIRSEKAGVKLYDHAWDGHYEPCSAAEIRERFNLEPT